MKKKIIGAVVALVAVAALVGLLLWLRATQPPEEDATSGASDVSVSSDAGAQYVLQAESGNPAKSVGITNMHGEFVLAQADGGYTVSGLEGLPVGIDLPALALELAGALKAKVDVGAGELSVYGLDTPQAEVLITYQDGATASLDIGAQAPGGEGYYVSAGGTAVYLVDGGDAEVFLSAPYAFLSTQVTGGNLEESALSGAILTGTVRAEAIEIEEELHSDDGETTYSTYHIVSPVQAGVSEEAGVAMLESLFGLEATAVAGLVEDASQLAEYGMDDPYSVIEVYSPGVGDFALTASAPDADGNVYLMNYVLPMVYLLPAESLPWLEAQALDIMDRRVLVPYIEKVVSVEVHTPEKDHAFALSQVNGILDVEYEGEALADSENFRSFFGVMASATYDEVADEIFEPDADDEPVLSFTYHYTDGGVDVVRFYTGAARRVYVMLNDNMAFMTSTTYVDKVYADIRRVLDGEPVSV